MVTRQMPVPDRADGGAAPWRIPAVLAGGTALLWMTLGVTLAQVKIGDHGIGVPTIWPFAAEPRIRTAEMQLASQSTSVARQTFAEATAVLRREPISVAAARVAALSAGAYGDGATSRRLLAYAEKLSRRDLGTQVGLIEYAAADGNLPVALRHYDTALRTGENAAQLLLPVLIEASHSPQVAEPLAQILSRQPRWRVRFAFSLVTSQPWAPTFTPLLTAARLNIADPVEHDLLTRAVNGLVQQNAVANAARLYEQATGSRLANTVRNSDFSAEDRVPPFDWNIADEPGLGAIKGPLDTAPYRDALSLNADPGRSGVVASQLTMLRAGRYRIRFLVGATSSSDQPDVSLTCNGANSPLFRLAFPVTNKPSRVEANFTIPSDCHSQWLTIKAATSIDATREVAGTPWITDIHVTPA